MFSDCATNFKKASKEIKTLVDHHGYILAGTAPDASSQNGMAERPHRTLKERVRCLLYSAGLGIEFWSDTLLHAAWLYNRTYHQSISMTPYQRWTGRIPSLDGLLTFGATIVSKKAKKRDTATDPNSFHGIFLGYRATMDNIVYWDTKSQSKRTAKHKTADEVQYSDPPAKRSPASKHLIEIITGTPHTSRRTDILLETVTECIDEATIKPSTNNFRTLIDSPSLSMPPLLLPRPKPSSTNRTQHGSPPNFTISTSPSTCMNPPSPNSYHFKALTPLSV